MFGLTNSLKVCCFQIYREPDALYAHRVERQRGTGLGMMWGRKQAEQMLFDAGFQEVEILEVEHDGFNLHYLCRGEKKSDCSERIEL